MRPVLLELSVANLKTASACSETNTSTAMEKLYGTTFSGIFGYGHITGGYPGGQAEFIRVPFANVNCSKLPDDVPDEKGLYLSDIVVTSHHAAVEADIQKGDIVGVWGGSSTWLPEIL